jgi:Tfp pilus assembly protein PilN
MSALRIDFARPGWRRRWHVLPLAWRVLLLLVGVVAVCAAMATARALREQAAFDEILQARQAREAAQRRAHPQSRPIALAPGQDKAVNAMIAQLNFPWSELDAALGEAASPDVALLSLAPDLAQQRLAISAETRTSDDMISYIEALKRVEFFSAVVLTRHEINEQDPVRPIRFQLEAAWSGKR